MDKRTFLQLIIETNANPTVRQLMSVGVSEGNAIEMIMRMNNRSADAIVKSAKELLKKVGD
jgi:uncharacterized protein YoaH (UPF0181 family)